MFKSKYILHSGVLIAMLMFCLLIQGAFVSSAFAQSAVVDGDVVNIRSGPGTNYQVSGTLLRGATVQVVKTQGEWTQVSYGVIGGWIFNNLLSTSSIKLSAPSVYLNGTQMTFEVPPIIENGRTMVPLRAIFEAMGASVTWNNDTRTVTAQKGSIHVVLPLNSLNPTINGTVYKLDVPAKIVNDRTLAPLRFVGEAFGGTVGWTEATRTVSIAASTENTPTVGNSYIKVKETEVNLRSGPSTSSDKIDTAHLGEELAVLREQDGWYQVSRSGNRVAWIAGWLVESQGQTGTEPPAPDTSIEQGIPIDEDDINRRGDENAVVEKGYLAISTRLAPDGYRLVMKTAEEVKPQITESEKGQKVLFTFKNLPLKTGRDEAYFIIGTGKNARMPISAQTVGDTTWVTIEMPLAYQYTTSVEANGCKQVFTIPSQLTEVQDISLKNGNQILALKATSSMQVQDSFKDGVITLTLPKTGKGSVNSNYTYLNVASELSIQESQDKQSVQVMITTGPNLDTYQVTRSLSGEMISIIMVNKNVKVDPTEPEKLVSIAIDPGHGGKDTGAISKSRKLMEKDVNLSIGLQVRDLLEKDGYKVIMTREDDTFVELKELPAIANRAGADLYVSIHCDSVVNPDSHGTGTFYYAPADKPALAAQNYQRSLLADLLQKAMLEKCGRTDRGIKQDNFCVLRETTMPSALVETAFLSNPTEEALLADPSFQTKAAQAIVQGIEKYVKLML